MNKKGLVVATVAAVVLVFGAAALIYKNRAAQDVKQAAQRHNEALVRAQATLFGNPAAKLTIIRVFRPHLQRLPAFFVKGTPVRDFGPTQLKALVGQKIAQAKVP